MNYFRFVKETDLKLQINNMKYFSILCMFLVNHMLMAQTIDESYSNYDFIPGETTLFEDKFIYENGETIGTHWEFKDGGGAASIVDFNGEKVLSFDAYYTRLKPRIFGEETLPDEFTIEYDAWLDKSYDSNPGVYISFELADGSRLPQITPSRDVITVFLPDNVSVSAENPAEYYESKFFNRWVHFSISVYKKTLRVYLDQYKIIEIPNMLVKPMFLLVNGDKSGEPGNGESPIYMKNFRLATGFPIDLFEGGKFVTHNIKFDVNKAVLKPESIVVIKQVKDYLDKNPSIKMLIAGHTDSDGTEEANMALSIDRAKAVKDQLVSMGISEDRLTITGYGELQPIENENTSKAKAMNRRVEFIVLTN